MNRNKGNKNLVFPVALFLLLTLPLAGRAQTTIDLLVWGDTGRWQPVLEGFRSRRPDIRVSMATQGGNAFAAQEALVVRMAAGTPPDLVLTHLDSHADGRRANFFADLQPFVQRDGVDLYSVFPEPAVDAFRDGGRLTALPIQATASVLWFNKSMFESHGLAYPDPEWRMTGELVDVARKLTRDHTGDGVADQWGFAPQNIWNWAAQYWGTSIYTEDLRRSNLLDPRVLDAATWVYDLYNTWAVVPRTVSARGAWEAGQLGMHAAIQSVLNWLPYVSFDWDAEVLPITPAGGRMTTGSMAAIAMVNGAKNDEAAWEFLKYIAEEDTQLLLLQTMGWGAGGPSMWRRYFEEFTKAMEGVSENSFRNWAAIGQSFLEVSYANRLPPDAGRFSALTREYLSQLETGVKSPRAILEEFHPVLEANLRQVWEEFDARSEGRN